MSALFSHAIRWEWTERNPIKSIRQSAKRMRTPDVLMPEEIMALLKNLPEPLRTAAQAEAGWSVQSRNRLGVCLADDERQATSGQRPCGDDTGDQH